MHTPRVKQNSFVKFHSRNYNLKTGCRVAKKVAKRKEPN